MSAAEQDATVDGRSDVRFADEPSHPIERVRTVFDRVRATDPTVADLYNDDAVVNVGGQTFRGRDAIRGFYLRTFERAGPQPRVRYTLGDWPFVAAVLDVEMSDGSMVSAVDLFELDESGIASMTAYTRPQGTPPPIVTPSPEGNPGGSAT